MIGRSGRWVPLMAASSIALLLTACGSDPDEGSGPQPVDQGQELRQMELSVPPDEAPPIVFAGDREKEYRLYAIEPDGTGREELTSEFAFSPTWSVEGDRIAFVGSLAVPGSADDGHNHGDSEEHSEDENLDPVHEDIGVTDFRLGLLTADGGSTRSEEAGEARGEPMYPTIDPRTKKVYFQVTPGFTRSGKDGKVRSAVDSVEAGQDGVSTVLEGSDSYYQPAWAPDGSRLAVIVSSCDGGDCRQELVLYDRDLKNPEKVVEGGVAGTPAWSPDGKEIAFSWSEGGRSGIWIVEPGEEPRRVTDGKRDSGPTFSPDGNSLAFTRGCDVYVVGAEGENLRNLTRTPGECEITPAWRP